MIILSTPLLIAFIGAAIYVFSGNSKAVELGRIMFAMGLLAALLVFSHMKF